MSAPKAESQPRSKAQRAYGLVPIPPQLFGKYRLVGKLGHGGMAEVNLALVEGTAGFRKLVVIKRLHPHLAMEPGFVDMFMDEARLAAQLNHPNCVQTNEVGEWNGNYFLAMEYLDGQGLERLLRIAGEQRNPIPFSLGVSIVLEALDGLAYAHQLAGYDGTPLNIIHRDISPQNIFVTYDGVVKLLDFGIAKAATHVVETRTGVIKGKYAYIAPEQALAQAIDQRADLWSMGVVLWEVLTGRRLFKSVNELATLHETLQGEIKPPSAFVPSMPPELDSIAMTALQRDPDLRYQTADAMKDALVQFLATVDRPGRRDVSRLMRDRFDEVLKEHKAMLARCLENRGTESIEQIMAVQPSMAVASHPGVSSSGLTPSGSTPGFTTSGAPSTSMPSGSHLTPSHSGIRGQPSAGVPNPPSGSTQLPFDSSFPPRDVSQPGVPPGMVVANPVPTSQRPSKLTVALILVIAILLLPVGYWVLWGSQPSPGGSLAEPTLVLPSESPDEASPSLTTHAEASPSSDAPSPTSTSSAESDESAVLDSENIDEPSPSLDVEANPSAVTEVVAPLPSDPSPTSIVARPHRPTRPRRSVQSSSREPTSVTDPPEPRPTRVAPPVDQTGYLTLVTTPWTEVSLGSRSLGTTPLVRFELPAGTHQLQLRNESAGITETYRVTISAGETTSRRLGLN